MVGQGIWVYSSGGWELHVTGRIKASIRLIHFEPFSECVGGFIRLKGRQHGGVRIKVEHGQGHRLSVLSFCVPFVQWAAASCPRGSSLPALYPLPAGNRAETSAVFPRNLPADRQAAVGHPLWARLCTRPQGRAMDGSEPLPPCRRGKHECVNREPDWWVVW